MTPLPKAGIRLGAPGPRASLHDQIAEHLGSRIVRGKLAPGEILPTEANLGLSFNVSRTAVREALKVLTSKGLLEIRRKTGTRVRPSTDWSALDPDVIAWQFSAGGAPSAIIDLLELREMVEPVCARFAAERATTAEIAEIQRAFAVMERATGRSAASTEGDLQFHLAILSAAHNTFMRSFGAMIQAALRASFQLTNKDEKAYQLSLHKHRAVLDAIAKRNAAEAERAMHAVLESTRSDIEHAMKAPTGRKKGIAAKTTAVKPKPATKTIRITKSRKS